MNEGSCVTLISLAAGVTRVESGGDSCLRGPEGDLTIGRMGPGLTAALEQLVAGASVDALECAALADGAMALAILHLALRRATSAGLLRRTLLAGGESLCTVEPLAPGPAMDEIEVSPEHVLQLSRFAAVSQVDTRLVAESPLANERIVIHSRRVAAMLLDLSAPRAVAELTARTELSPEVLRAALAVLLGSRIAVLAGDGGAEDDGTAARSWEAHDLWFHTRSRHHRPRMPYGRIDRATLPGDFAVPPPAPAAPTGPFIALDRAELGRLIEADVPFTRVIEQRRSVRHFGERPISLGQLGHLLHRAAGVRARVGQGADERTVRPYPGGGACYELGIYVAVRRCEGLPPGLYLHDAEAHRLHLVRHGDALVNAVIDEAAGSAMVKEPQVLLVLGARFQRITWKYRSMAYALILKDTGVLMHSLCLVAQAMNLGACPLGGGTSANFTRAAGLDPLEETSVGELLVGTG